MEKMGGYRGGCRASSRARRWGSCRASSRASASGPVAVRDNRRGCRMRQPTGLPGRQPGEHEVTGTGRARGGGRAAAGRVSGGQVIACSASRSAAGSAVR
ncbi:hypothetical protein Dimus_005534, partial [Dionaea muscipula]